MLAVNWIHRKHTLIPDPKLVEKLCGVLLPIPTPFHGDGAVDYSGLRSIIEKWNTTGIAGYVVLGLANTIVLVFVGSIISCITGGNISAAQAYIADVTTKEIRVKGMALFGAAFGLCFVLGPAIGGITSKF